MPEESAPVVALLDQLDDPSVRERMAALLATVGARLAQPGGMPSGRGIVGLIVGPGMRVDAPAVRALPDLRVVAASSTGADHICIDEVSARGGWVTHVPDYCTEEVADHALAMILVLLRGVGSADRAVRRGEWLAPVRDPQPIAGTRLALIGFGRIAQGLAARATALGMQVSSFDPAAGDETFRRLSVRRCPDMAEALAGADVVSIHVPLVPATRGLIDAAALRLMRPGSFLINVARGGLVDQDALVLALRAGRLGGAALDVLQDEPPRAGDPLLALDNVVLTPHIGWQSAAARDRAFTRATESVVAVLAGEEPRDALSRPPATRPAATPDLLQEATHRA